MMAQISNNNDEQFEEEIETIKSLYPDQVRISGDPITISCIMSNNIYITETIFIKSSDNINISISNKEKSNEKHSKQFLQKLESKLYEICKEECDSMPIYQCISYLNESLNDYMEPDTNNNNNNNNNNDNEEKKNDNTDNGEKKYITKSNKKKKKKNKNKKNNKSNIECINDKFDYKHYVKDVRVTDEFILFYKDVFSQWFPCKMIIDNNKYENCEQYMMAEKAKLFNDDYYWNLIMKETDPFKIKKLGRGVRNFDENEWKQHREQIVYRGNLAKFTQNEILKRKLLSYDSKLYFVEASGVDKIWGIGLKVTDPMATYKRNWVGLNLLGRAITKVRNHIIQQNL